MKLINVDAFDVMPGMLFYNENHRSFEIVLSTKFKKQKNRDDHRLIDSSRSDARLIFIDWFCHGRVEKSNYLKPMILVNKVIDD